LYDTTDVTTVHNHSSFTSIASWMSQCLSEKQLQHTIDTPEQLADDERLGWLGIGMSWASVSARSASLIQIVAFDKWAKLASL